MQSQKEGAAEAQFQHNQQKKYVETEQPQYPSRPVSSKNNQYIPFQDDEEQLEYSSDDSMEIKQTYQNQHYLLQDHAEYAKKIKEKSVQQ